MNHASSKGVPGAKFSYSHVRHSCVDPSGTTNTSGSGNPLFVWSENRGLSAKTPLAGAVVGGAVVGGAVVGGAVVGGAVVGGAVVGGAVVGDVVVETGVGDLGGAALGDDVGGRVDRSDAVDEPADRDAGIGSVDRAVSVGVGNEATVGDVVDVAGPGSRRDADDPALGVGGQSAAVPARDRGIGLDPASDTEPGLFDESGDGAFGERDRLAADPREAEDAQPLTEFERGRLADLDGGEVLDDGFAVEPFGDAAPWPDRVPDRPRRRRRRRAPAEAGPGCRRWRSGAPPTGTPRCG